MPKQLSKSLLKHKTNANNVQIFNTTKGSNNGARRGSDNPPQPPVLVDSCQKIKNKGSSEASSSQASAPNTCIKVKQRYDDSANNSDFNDSESGEEEPGEPQG